MDRKMIAVDSKTYQLMVTALVLAQRLNTEALPKFNWGASALDANAIDLLNRTPRAVDKALDSLKEYPR